MSFWSPYHLVQSLFFWEWIQQLQHSQRLCGQSAAALKLFPKYSAIAGASGPLQSVSQLRWAFKSELRSFQLSQRAWGYSCDEFPFTSTILGRCLRAAAAFLDAYWQIWHCQLSILYFANLFHDANIYHLCNKLVKCHILRNPSSSPFDSYAKKGAHLDKMLTWKHCNLSLWSLIKSITTFDSTNTAFVRKILNLQDYLGITSLLQKLRLLNNNSLFKNGNFLY